jgi:hypothetical protein
MRNQFLVSAILLTCLAPLNANALTCTPPPQLFDETKKIDTEGAVGQFMKLVGLNVKSTIASETNAVFTTFQNADQMIVALTLIYTVCTNLNDDKEMTTPEKNRVLMELIREFRTTATGPQPISSTAPARNPLPSPQDQPGGEKKSRWLPDTAVIHLAAMTSTRPSAESRKLSWADIYLNATPFVITDKNKYFVIVGSAANEAQGTQKMNSLKRKYPDYDFELYGPYGSNPSFGIMIASWVSRERANEALNAAKKIEPTSFMWSCRGTGDAC